MNKKRMRVWSLLLCGVILFGSIVMVPCTAPQARAATLAELENKLNALKQEQKELDQKLQSLKNQQKNQLAYQQSLQKKITNAQSQIDTLNEQIRGYDKQIAEKEGQIADKEVQIGTSYTTLKARLKAIYMLGEASTLDIVFSSKNVEDFFNKVEFVQAVAQHDQTVIHQLKDQQESIRLEKESIQQDRTELAKAKTEYDAQRKQLEQAMAESKRVSQQLQASQDKTEDKQKEIDAAFAAADKEIEQWWIDYYKKQEEANKPVGTGNFMWPMPGYYRKSNITSYFGGTRNHRGLDISGAGIYGKPIVAADSGVVAIASYNHATYGIYLQIDHGNKVATLYGHTSGLAVKAGDVVKKGQTIAYVGSSGKSTGPHLHFGVLINGKPVDPLNYFKLT